MGGIFVFIPHYAHTQQTYGDTSDRKWFIYLSVKLSNIISNFIFQVELKIKS